MFYRSERRIRYYDSDTDKEFTFLTNNLTLSSGEVALLCRNRWPIELFSRWIKKHLRVLAFWGFTENAVKIQLYCVMIAYCFAAKKNILHPLDGDTLFDNQDICQLLKISKRTLAGYW